MRSLATVVLVGGILLACSSPKGAPQGVVEVEENPSGCTGLLPAAAMKDHGLDVELANLTVKQISLGNFKVEYSETMKALLGDQALADWVRQEMICHGARSFRTPEQRIWYLTMKEVAQKGDSSDLLQWLRENPMEAFGAEPISVDDVVQIESISGKVILPEDIFTAEVGRISSFGTLVIPGNTRVVIENCSGNVRHVAGAKVIIKKSTSFCSQEVISGE